ncbi:MAG TPA: peptidylprolyl isomerase [Chthoniobacterales bacterium]|jgi:peptidyl-prolyl cis-trans isomerase SurA|nr:peptidylprolyl isomerase [Chthoniobacterales bacterium]
MIRPIVLTVVTAVVVNVSPICRAAYAAQPEPEVVDGVAAVVNGDVITYSQVRQVVAPREKLLRSQFNGDELVNKVKEARQAALQDLIDRQLIIQAFKKENFQIPDHFVEERMQDIIRTDFGGDRNTFIKTLEAQKFTLGEFKKMEMDKIIVQAMRSKNVKLNNIASPAKVDEYYKAHREDFTSKEQVKLRLIMIPGHSSDGEAAAQKAMADEVFGKLVNGAEFERMAQLYSEDSTREKGGDWGWIDRKTLAGPLEKVVFNLPVGKISKVVEFSGNYYIMKIEEKHGGETKSLDQARPDIEKKLIQLEAQSLQEKWLASLRSKAYIKTF